MSGYVAKAREPLVSAQLLVDAGQLGGAANRAYYAFFHAAQAAIAHVANINPRTVKTHSGLHRLFELHVVKRGLIQQSVASDFSSVESTRIVADYGDESIQRDEVVAAIQRAGVFLEACEALLQRQVP